MVKDNISTPEKTKQLAEELAEYHGNPAFLKCRSQGATGENEPETDAAKKSFPDSQIANAGFNVVKHQLIGTLAENNR